MTQAYNIAYDRGDDVIFLDLTGCWLDHPMVDSIVSDIIQIAQGLDHKVYLLACWKDAGVRGETAAYYATKGAAILPYLAGAVRYGVTELSTRVALRSAHTNVKERQGAASNIFESREQAMIFIRGQRMI